MVEVCLLGCGGMMPLPGRALSALLCRFTGSMVLIDCGEGTQVPLREAGWGFKAIDCICLTHYHADHVAGLPGLLLTIAGSGREEPLTLVGPPGLTDVVAGLTVIVPGLPFDLKLAELPAGVPAGFRLANGVLLGSFPVEHHVPCLAYSLTVERAGKFDAAGARARQIPVRFWKKLQRGESVDFGGRTLTPDLVTGPARRGIKVSYCTDLRPSAPLERFVADSDLLVCEGMYGEDEMLPKAMEKKHMTFSEAARLARGGGCRELWLTHYSPSLAQPESFLQNAQAVFPAARCGRSLMSITLSFDQDER